MSTSTFPSYRGHMEYVCLGCGARFSIEELHYTCPSCGGVFLLTDNSFDELKKTSAAEWRAIFDQRAASKNPALRGVFRFYELMAPVLEEEDILYLGEGNTPIVDSPPALRANLGLKTAYKNDGQNPSASFKDRGMACAFSFLKSLIRTKGWTEVLAICASTGDTSAAASLYASYVGGAVKSAVILPAGKVTPQQLAQPLGSGAVVLEVPGVFDDCMKVVEHLADNYRVALLNSKKVILEVWKEWEGQFGRKYEPIEAYQTERADVLMLTMGSMGETAEMAIDELRAEGVKAGLLKLKLWRPFPAEELRQAVRGAKALIVTDRCLSYGAPRGPVAMEVASALYGEAQRPAIVNYIIGLGGRDVMVDHFKDMIHRGAKAATEPSGEAYEIYGVRGS